MPCSKTCPFLLRSFVKIGGHHRLGVFEDNVLPVADEYQLYTWKDATLRELVTSLRALPPNPLTSSLRHGAARFSFRTIFADPTDRGRISYKDLGTVHARDLTQINLLEGDFETEQGVDELERRAKIEEKDKKIAEERTIDELRVQPGDWLDVAVIVPTPTGALGTTGAFGVGGPGGSGIKGAAATRGVGRGGDWDVRAPNTRWSRDTDPKLNHSWRGGTPRVAAPSRGGVGGGHEERNAFSDRGRGRGAALNRRGLPRRGSPDRTLGGADDGRVTGRAPYRRGRSRSRSRSRSINRSRSPVRRRTRSRSRSPHFRSRSPRSRSPPYRRRRDD